MLLACFWFRRCRTSPSSQGGIDLSLIVILGTHLLVISITREFHFAQASSMLQALFTLSHRFVSLMRSVENVELILLKLYAVRDMSRFTVVSIFNINSKIEWSASNLAGYSFGPAIRLSELVTTRSSILPCLLDGTVLTWSKECALTKSQNSWLLWEWDEQLTQLIWGRVTSPTMQV